MIRGPIVLLPGSGERDLNRMGCSIKGVSDMQSRGLELPQTRV